MAEKSFNIYGRPIRRKPNAMKNKKQQNHKRDVIQEMMVFLYNLFLGSFNKFVNFFYWMAEVDMIVEQGIELKKTWLPYENITPGQINKVFLELKRIRVTLNSEIRHCAAHFFLIVTSKFTLSTYMIYYFCYAVPYSFQYYYWICLIIQRWQVYICSISSLNQLLL